MLTENLDSFADIFLDCWLGGPAPSNNNNNNNKDWGVCGGEQVWS
jgi:hypothetical protein